MAERLRRVLAHLTHDGGEEMTCKEAKSAPKKAAAPVKVYTTAEVAKHNSSSSCWIIIHGKVYDVTNFALEHPGGGDLLLDEAGTDCTEKFESQGHSEDAIKLLKDYLIGSVKK